MFLDFSKPDEMQYRAEMTKNQFAALAYKLNTSDIENEILNNKYFQSLRRCKNVTDDEIKRWLNNSWHTEQILNSSSILFSDNSQSYAIQWSFPQAYYAIFLSVLGLYKTIGNTEHSHAAVLKKFGLMLSENKFPESLSFYTSGTSKNLIYHNIIKPKGLEPIKFTINEPDTIDNQICQFLSSTRRDDLSERKPKYLKDVFKNKKQNLNEKDWENLANSMGFTTVLDFLYRKRIKANYENIDTFVSEYFKGPVVHEYLCNIVNRVNLITECYIAKAISFDIYSKIVGENQTNGPFKERLERVGHIVYTSNQ